MQDQRGERVGFSAVLNQHRLDFSRDLSVICDFVSDVDIVVGVKKWALNTGNIKIWALKVLKGGVSNLRLMDCGIGGDFLRVPSFPCVVNCKTNKDDSGKCKKKFDSAHNEKWPRPPGDSFLRNDIALGAIIFLVRGLLTTLCVECVGNSLYIALDGGERRSRYRLLAWNLLTLLVALIGALCLTYCVAMYIDD